MKLEALRQEGYELLHDGVVELALIECNGIRIDMPRMERTKAELAKKIRAARSDLETSQVWRKWKKRFANYANLISRRQLATILYEEMGFSAKKLTLGGSYSADEEALKNIDHPFVLPYLKFMRYEKALGTFLTGIEKEVVDDRLHPSFNLHTVRSYRSSSTEPNFQNFPVRDAEISKIIRSHFIPSPKSSLVENDFKGIEVGVSACYHRDRNFISYITTAGKDMHRDMAAQIYMLRTEDVSKDARYGAKNKFVFPQFYGDFYVACAKNLWEWIDKATPPLTGPKGIPLKEHLKSKGIKKLGACDPEQKPKPGTFEKHLKDVEDDFWNNRFMTYGKWRKDWYRSYLDKGYFDLYTGFRIYGSFQRNAVTNYPVQGSAFHCLLWSLIQVNRRLRKYKLKSMVVGQIHDSLIGDVLNTELRDYLEIVEEVTTVDLRKHYKDWLIVPLEIEYEIAVDNWYDKKPFKFNRGIFTHPTDLDKHTGDQFKFLKALRKTDGVV